MAFRLRTDHDRSAPTPRPRRRRALAVFRYLGPGLLVTVGFIDPGNWASNLAAGGEYGYALLWMVTLSTLMLIVLQHNAAHLGIVTGLCLSEAATLHFRQGTSRLLLTTAMLASISTSLAEILGGAIALDMLFGIPVRLGALLVTLFVAVLLLTNGYRPIEKWIIAFVSLIGLSFIYELTLTHIDWPAAARAWVVPAFPEGSMVIVMSVLGAVVMPHNLFLHSEVIQSRQWNLSDERTIRHQLRYEYFDTIFSMVVGWAINSAMILLAAATLHRTRTPVEELQQARTLLEPLLGTHATVVFAVALLLAGIASTVTSGMAAGSIFAGMFGAPYDMRRGRTRAGMLLSLGVAFLTILLIRDPFRGLIYSQMALSLQLPVTVFMQVRLTSSERVMGTHRNRPATRWLLYLIGGAVTALNLMLLVSFLR